MEHLLVFALIGLLGGASARLLYPGRQPMRILGTLALGVLGALAGGVISRSNWSADDGHFQSGNIVMAVLGAMMAIMFWAAVSYARSLSGSRTRSP
jgi:uncharacterized membrane protein YeaQ/YmgE (transglycosylase-associated protein family)